MLLHTAHICFFFLSVISLNGRWFYLCFLRRFRVVEIIVAWRRQLQLCDATVQLWWRSGMIYYAVVFSYKITEKCIAEVKYTRLLYIHLLPACPFHSTFIYNPFPMDLAFPTCLCNKMQLLSIQLILHSSRIGEPDEILIIFYSSSFYGLLSVVSLPFYVSCFPFPL